MMLIRMMIASLLLAGAPAFAQEDPLEPGGALLDEEAGLLERKKPKKKVLGDPDAKARDALEQRRGALEKRINILQGRAGKFAKTEEAMNKVTGDMLKAFERFFPEHGKLLGKYREALADNRGEKQKKIAKKVAKLRAAFTKTLDKLEKSADKVDGLIAELEEKVKEEEAEDAEEGGGDE